MLLCRAGIIAAATGGGGEPPVVPAGELLEATFWLRAEDASLTLGAGNAVSAASNQGSAGSAMNLTQATGSAQPVWVPDVLNGKAVLRFDGGDWLRSAAVAGTAFLTTNQYVVFLVIKQTGVKARNTPFAWRTAASTDRLVTHLSYDDTLFWDAGDSVASAGRISAAQPVGWDDAFRIVELVRDGTTSWIIIDGVEVSTDATMTTAITLATSQAFSLGAQYNDTDLFQGDIAEIIVASGATAVNSVTRQEARDALAAYYFGVDSSIPLYETFELPVINATTYSNRYNYTVVQITCVFTAPSAATYTIHGFYAGMIRGQHTWKIRFSPIEVGTWTYTYSWNGGTPAGGSGSFTATSKAIAALHGPLQTDGTRYLKHWDNTPHFMLMSGWIWSTLIAPTTKGADTNADGNNYPTDAQLDRGHRSDTVLDAELDQLVIYEHNTAYVAAGSQIEDDGISWDQNWCARLDRFMQQCMARGVYCGLSMFNPWTRDKAAGAWFRYNVTNRDSHPFNAWAVDGAQPGLAAALNAIRYAIARWGGYSTTWWELGNEVEHSDLDSGELTYFLDRAADTYLPAFADRDPYDRPVSCSERGSGEDLVAAGLQLIGVHQADESSTGLIPASTVARWHCSELVRDELTPGSEILTYDSSMRNSSYRIRYRHIFWRPFCQGACGVVAATWRDLGNYTGALLNVLGDERRLKQFIDDLTALGISINSMPPLSTSIVTAGPGSISGAGRWRTRAQASICYVTYIEDAGSNSAGNLTASLPTGTWTVDFYNPSSGVYTAGTNSPVSGSGSTTIAYPAFTDDIVMRITVPSAPAAPVNTALPEITGTPTVGQTLSASTGTWTGNPTPTYGYEWLRSGSTVVGTSSTYVLVTADIGTNSISVRVTATNSQGSASATSSAVTVSAGGAAAPAFDSFAITADATSVTAKTVTISGVAGDLLIGWVTYIHTSGTISAPTGAWNELIPLTAHTGEPLQLTQWWWKVLSGSESSQQFNVSVNTDEWSCGVLKITGANASAPIDGTPAIANSATSVSPVCPDFTTLGSNRLVLRAFIGRGIGSTGDDQDYPADTTGVFKRQMAGPENLQTVGVAYHTAAAAGAVGTATWTDAQNSARYFGITIAVKP